MKKLIAALVLAAIASVASAQVGPGTPRLTPSNAPLGTYATQAALVAAWPASQLSTAGGPTAFVSDGTGPEFYDGSAWQKYSTGGASGTVTAVTGVNTHGFSWSIATNTTTPAITLSTTITGLLVGSGGALANATAADILTLFPGSAIPATDGGTGLTSYSTGDLICASAANTLSALHGNTTVATWFLQQIGDGTNSACPTWGVLGAANIPNLNTIKVTAGIWTAPRLTGDAAFVIGDLTPAGSTTALSRLPDVATGQLLVSGGVGALPAYSAIVPTGSVAPTITFTGCTGTTNYKGGTNGGTFNATGSGACSFTVTGLPTNTNGYLCSGEDLTSKINWAQGSTILTTGCTIAGNVATTGDLMKITIDRIVN